MRVAASKKKRTQGTCLAHVLETPAVGTASCLSQAGPLRCSSATIGASCQPTFTRSDERLPSAPTKSEPLNAQPAYLASQPKANLWKAFGRLVGGSWGVEAPPVTKAFRQTLKVVALRWSATVAN